MLAPDVQRLPVIPPQCPDPAVSLSTVGIRPPGACPHSGRDAGVRECGCNDGGLGGRIQGLNKPNGQFETFVPLFLLLTRVCSKLWRISSQSPEAHHATTPRGFSCCDNSRTSHKQNDQHCDGRGMDIGRVMLSYPASRLRQKREVGERGVVLEPFYLCDGHRGCVCDRERGARHCGISQGRVDLLPAIMFCLFDQVTGPDGLSAAPGSPILAVELNVVS